MSGHLDIDNLLARAGPFQQDGFTPDDEETSALNRD